MPACWQTRQYQTDGRDHHFLRSSSARPTTQRARPTGSTGWMPNAAPSCPPPTNIPAATPAGTWRWSIRRWCWKPPTARRISAALNDRGEILLPADCGGICSRIIRTWPPDSRRRRPHAPDRQEAGPAIHRRRTFPAAIDLLHRPRPQGMFACDDDHTRPLRRLRLRSRLPVRADRPEAWSAPTTSATWCFSCPTRSCIVDHHGKRAYVLEYDFRSTATTTEGLPRDGETPYRPRNGRSGAGRS
jgi:hypothetical protein